MRVSSALSPIGRLFALAAFFEGLTWAGLLELLTKRSEQPSGGRGRRAGTAVYEWYMPIPSTGRARLAAAQ